MHRDVRTAIAGLVLACSTVPGLCAQGVFADPEDITIQAIADAETSRHLSLRQVRRVLVPGHDPNDPYRWVSISEKLEVAPDLPDGTPRFDLQFGGLLGSSATPSQAQLRKDLYAGYAGFLFMHASFRIDDPVAAAQNYFVHYIGARSRIGRPVQRVALLPKKLGRNPWVLDLDVETGFPMYRAEFTATGLLVSSLEIVEFTELGSTTPLGTWWTPRNRTVDYPTIQEALKSLPQASFTFPDAGTLPAGYGFTRARVVKDDLSRETTLILIYSDGIDEIFLLQTLNAPPPTLPAPPKGSTGTPYAVFVYQDLNVAQLMFYTNGIQFMVVGHVSQPALSEVARTLLSKSLTGR